MARRGFYRGRALAPPVPETDETFTAPDVGAIPLSHEDRHKETLREGAESYAFHRVPVTFDFVSIIASPSSGSTTQLIGPSSPNGVDLGQIPRDYRGIVDGVFPYLEGQAGVSYVGPRIVGTGVQIIWSLLIDAQGAGQYGNITTILTPWNGMSDRPLFDIRPGALLTAQVTNVDPNGLYPYIGIRVKGRFVPWADERGFSADQGGGPALALSRAQKAVTPRSSMPSRFGMLAPRSPMIPTGRR